MTAFTCPICDSPDMTLRYESALLGLTIEDAVCKRFGVFPLDAWDDLTQINVSYVCEGECQSEDTLPDPTIATAALTALKVTERATYPLTKPIPLGRFDDPYLAQADLSCPQCAPSRILAIVGDYPIDIDIVGGQPVLATLSEILYTGIPPRLYCWRNEDHVDRNGTKPESTVLSLLREEAFPDCAAELVRPVASGEQ